ncbi:MAG TPA: outer membrane protein transport protein [Usitatibacteraceae bacterium]|nr:outer membrane protein transport protein [Usitatibacteraceae bacterium]
MSRNRFAHRSLVALVGLALAAPFAHATNGYFSHGYGMKSKGMGGASVALAQDAFAGANNPAAGAFAGERMDAGLDWFSPRRKVERTASGGGMLDFSADSGSNHFFVPEFGYNTKGSGALSWGITVYGNGGMNTDFPGGQLNCSPLGGPPSANGLCGQGSLGVDLSQLIVAPHAAWKLAPDHAIGIAPLFAYQRFEMNGAQLFGGLSQSPGEVSNRGYDSSTGWGVRVGYQGRVAPGVTVGAAYTTRTRMGKFDKYKGLFADDGDFDIPAHLTAGIAFEPAKGVTVAVDWERIKYSGVGSVGNPSTNQAPLGASGGPGFGWSDIDVWKIGVQWQASPALQLRAGYNKSDNPIASRDVSFNILAPGVIEDHLTLGATWSLGKDSELTVAYMHAFTNSVEGFSFFNAFAPGQGGREKIEMYQNAFGVAWSRRW